MLGVLVVDAMHLRSLEEEPNPAWRLDVGVVEKLAQRCAGRIDRSALQA